MAILAQQFPVYKPSMRIVTSITNGFPASVTTSFPHGYITGTILRLIVPEGFGMTQANKMSGMITVTSPTTFTLPIDTSNFDVFSTPSSYPQNYQYSQCVPFGEDNAILQAAVQNVLPYRAI